RRSSRTTVRPAGRRPYRCSCLDAFIDARICNGNEGALPMTGDFIAGASYLLKGIGLLRRRGIRAYVVVPLTINVVLFAAALFFGGEWFSKLIEAWIPDWLRWIEWLLWIVFAVLAAGLVFFGFVVVANLIASPFNGFLSEAVEVALSGQRPTSIERSLIA